MNYNILTIQIITVVIHTCVIEYIGFLNSVVLIRSTMWPENTLIQRFLKYQITEAMEKRLVIHNRFPYPGNEKEFLESFHSCYQRCSILHSVAR